MANATTTASRLFRHLRSRPAPQERDFADYGTAFGLEMSLQPADPAAPATRPSRDPGWWRRLAARRDRPGP